MAYTTHKIGKIGDGLLLLQNMWYTCRKSAIDSPNCCPVPTLDDQLWLVWDTLKTFKRFCRSFDSTFTGTVALHILRCTQYPLGHLETCHQSAKLDGSSRCSPTLLRSTHRKCPAGGTSQSFPKAPKKASRRNVDATVFWGSFSWDTWELGITYTGSLKWRRMKMCVYNIYIYNIILYIYIIYTCKKTSM